MTVKTRHIREQVKSSLHTLFVLGQRAGWDILPRHFYSSIPDIHKLKASEGWKRPCSMTGVHGTEIDSQIRFLRECCGPALQARLRQRNVHESACRENGEAGYGRVESDVLFCFVMTKRPKRIIQVGCGVSTAVILQAAKEAAYRPHLVCLDPFPSSYLKQLAKQNVIDLIAEEAQEGGHDVFSQLDCGDLLFVDSTHAVRVGSEVNLIILEVLPRIRSGCFVHFHDICFPYDYQPSVERSLFFGAESTLLHAFLIDNARYGIACSLSMLHHTCPEELRSILPDYRPAAMHYGLYDEPVNGGHFPSSTYLLVR